MRGGGGVAAWELLQHGAHAGRHRRLGVAVVAVARQHHLAAVREEHAVRLKDRQKISGPRASEQRNDVNIWTLIINYQRVVSIDSHDSHDDSLRSNS